MSVQDQIDTQNPMGKAMFTIIGAMAELESSLVSERVKACMAATKSRGRTLRRSKILEGVEEKIDYMASTTT